MNKDRVKKGAEAHVMRVFVSSTFRDMQAERDELAKFIFPQLRKLCEQRGVTWGEVDLRWGITDEQKSEGKVLPICLDEIQRCRPYFIGLLGERYGWIPDDIPPELIDHEPWLAEHPDHSVTELEILHGVLNEPEMAENAFFYFRDPAYIQSLPGGEQPVFREEPSADDVRKFGSDEATRRAEGRRRKLAILKERIRNSGFPVHENYQNPQVLGQMVLKDMTAIIDDLYPEGSQPDQLDREAAEQEVFAHSRAGVYIGRQAYFDRLDAHACADGPPMVILGESGSGKSALLANWALRYRKEHPDDLLLMHFIGATPASGDWAAMLRRILEEFKRKFNIQEAIPDQPDGLRNAFANWLNMVAARGRVILILDALNQLEDRDGAPDLAWLPPTIPGTVRMFFSSLPGRPLDELQKRGWPVLSVEPLQPEERKQLIHEYLALFTKALSPNHLERIASATQCQNPLFLRVLLDELRLFGMHERLGERIEAYLGAATIPALYELILERYERDYERERPGLVREAVSLLWAARRGLSEVELMDLLGADGQSLPRSHWSPLYLALEQSFLSRGGLIGFFHDYLRQAVQNRYLPDLSVQKLVHLDLANYFEAQSGDSPRRLEELSWQLAQAREWQRLYILLGDLVFFKAAWETNPFEVKAYWAQVETDSSYRMLDAYRQVIDHPDNHQESVSRVSILLSDTGHLEEALALCVHLVEHYRREGDQANLQVSLGIQAHILADLGDMDGAMALYQKKECICRELGNKDGQWRALSGQAFVLFIHGDLDGAMALYKETESICRVLGDKAGLGKSLGNQALILKNRGDLDGAMTKQMETERICRQEGDKAGLGNSFSNQALILSKRGNLDEAMRLHKEAESICRELGDKARLQLALGYQAGILYYRGDLDQALALYKEQERISRELGNKDGLERSLGNQSGILADRGDLDGALALLKEAESICRELGDKNFLQFALGNQACILSERGDLDEAMRLHKEAESICRELGDMDRLQDSLGNQALIFKARGDLAEAMRLHKEEERICREVGNKADLGGSLGNQANILFERGDLDGAMRLHEDEERIYRELGIKTDLGNSLGSQGLILKARGDLDGAMRLHKEEERLYREVKNKAGVGGSLGNQAVILKDRGDLDGAMGLHQEEERIYRELGNKAGLGSSLGNQALVLAEHGNLDGAMKLHREEERIFRELGNPQGLAVSLKNQAVALAKMGNQGEAHRLVEESLKLAKEHGYRLLIEQIKTIKDKL